MASGKTEELRALSRYTKNPKRLPEGASRDRSLTGKARIRARREEQRAQRESQRA